jgi:hypothetical protein
MMMKKIAVTMALAVLAAASALAQHIVITPSGARPTIRGPERAYTGTAG